MTRWLRPMTERPFWVLGAVLAFTLFCLAGLVDPRTGAPRLGIDPSATAMLPSGGPERELYEKARRLFGSDESIVVGVGAEDVFTPEVLERVAAMTRAIEAIDGVQNVLSLATALNVRSSAEGDIEVAPFLETIPREAPALERLRREALGNPIYAGTLVSRDARATALLVSLERMTDQELIQRRMDARVVEAARAEAGDLELWVSGVPHVKTFLSESLLRELGWMLPLILVLIAGVLWISSRTLRGVVIPLVTVLLALLWTLGALGWLGQQLNLVTIMVPALILVLGFTYALHLTTEYDAEVGRPGAPAPREAMRHALEALWVAIVVTAVTTVAGFVSLALNPIVAIREFGLFSALGVILTLVVSLTFVPALLAVLPRPRRAAREVREGWFEALAERLGGFAIEHRRAFIVGACVFLAIAVLGMTRIRVSAEFPGNLRADNPVRLDYEAINARFGGANQMRILLETDVPEGFLEPANLREMQALQEWLEAQPEVGETVSIADYVKLLHRSLAGTATSDAGAELPDSKRLVSQLLLFGASPETKRFADARYQTANVLAFANVGSSDAISDLVGRVEARLRELPPHLRASVTGSAVLLNRVVDDVSWGQFTSLTSAFLQIYLVLVLMFMSFRVGALALLPNAVPIFGYFAVLGFTGITLNPSTSLVGSLALGVVVDDTIHFFARFNSEARQLADEKKAAGTALRALIRPVTFTTIGLCAGFLVLTGSEQRTQAEFGILAASTFAFAWLCDVLLSPALCSGVRIVTLWDVLRLDLGREPQNEIGMFRGLSLRQARIFALMSEIRRLPAGGRLFAERDRGDDMFVILNGELVPWVDREGRRVGFPPMGRGDVVGETGFFGGTRTATVDATSDALLIRFDADDLERLRRRYPRIAAVVYRNLNLVQAERLARTTLKVQGAA
jgi:predicted RND superfamily exporter protein